MILKRKPPNDRSLAQLLNHYLVEIELAARLKNATRKERADIYSYMYDELFSKVPDHPRLTRRQSIESSLKSTSHKLNLLRRYIDKSNVYLEFGPGDCKFSFEVAKKVKHAYGVDISDQRDPADKSPENFKLILYDGFKLDDVDNNSVDLVFSDQLIEHIHPDDTLDHFKLVHKVLRRGGMYVFDTPHKLTGPHDVSKFFSDVPEGFHLKEWSYREIWNLLNVAGYSRFQTRWTARGLNYQLPFAYFSLFELIGSWRILGKKHKRRLMKVLIPSLYGVAVK